VVFAEDICECLPAHVFDGSETTTKTRFVCSFVTDT